MKRDIVLPVIVLFSLILAGCQSNQKTEERFIDARSSDYLRLGTEALERYEFGLAMAFADSAEHYTPELPDASFLRGRIYSELEDFERAAAAYELTIQRDSEYRGVWHNMGNNAYRMHEYDEAIQLYKKEIAQQSAPVPWRGIGRAYVELGYVDSARWAFEQAIQLDSLYAPAYFNLALLLEDEGVFEEALDASQTAWRLSPLDTDFRYLMASLLVSNQKFVQAIPHLQAVTEERPWHHASHYNLGQALVRAGDRMAGEEYLQKAEDLRAQDAQIKQLLNSSMTLGANPLTQAALGSALRKVGRYQDAMRAYKMATFLDPSNLEIQTNLANLYLLQGDTLATIREYHSILQKDPSFTGVWVNLGIVYAISGQKEYARRAWQEALRIEPENSVAKSYLSRL